MKTLSKHIYIFLVTSGLNFYLIDKSSSYSGLKLKWMKILEPATRFRYQIQIQQCQCHLCFKSTSQFAWIILCCGYNLKPSPGVNIDQRLCELPTGDWLCGHRLRQLLTGILRMVMISVCNKQQPFVNSTVNGI